MAIGIKGIDIYMKGPEKAASRPKESTIHDVWEFMLDLMVQHPKYSRQLLVRPSVLFSRLTKLFLGRISSDFNGFQRFRRDFGWIFKIFQAFEARSKPRTPARCCLAPAAGLKAFGRRSRSTGFRCGS